MIDMHLAYVTAKRTLKVSDRTHFRKINNTLCNLTRQDQRNHLDLITSDHTNPKPFWNWIKRVKNGVTCIPDIPRRYF